MPAFASIWRAALCAALALALAAVAASLLVRVPSNERRWAIDQQRLPVAEIAADSVTLRNIRNFSYRSEYDFAPAYYDRTFSLQDVVDVDYVVEPLASVAAAHTFLSFGLQNGERIAISVEIRKEEGEVFNPLLGLVHEYELMYVVADERDVVALRVIHRGNPVHAYPTTATPPQARALLADMLARLNHIAAEPEFYNTFTNNCATNIARHVNAIAPRRVPWSWRLLFPRTSDAYAQQLGLIAAGESLESARARYLVNDAVRRHADDPGFSRKIREER